MVDIKGRVVGREEGRMNGNVKTGKIEIEVERVRVLNEGKTPAFVI